MSFDISKLRSLLSKQNSSEFKKPSDLSLGLIGMVNTVFDGDFESNTIKLTADDFFSVTSCGFFMFETCSTVNLNGGYARYSFSDDKYISLESTIPRSLFLMCYSNISYDNENEAKDFYMETNKAYDELSNRVHAVYMNNRNWSFLYENLGISHLFGSQTMNADFENKITLLNGIASS
ncbi:hypothetical protein [Serratia liquefaciens]|uniref:hypothetical protein n=1 Tax=Serratia liquefaciens TaxID=614 RepID=UPI001F1D121D|nr:hypothetical protein [Serratia liquefaciens]MCE9940195.1 hypothetical protein [Serratia liquefaciens]